MIWQTYHLRWRFLEHWWLDRETDYHLQSAVRKSIYYWLLNITFIFFRFQKWFINLVMMHLVLKSTRETWQMHMLDPRFSFSYVSASITLWDNNNDYLNFDQSEQSTLTTKKNPRTANPLGVIWAVPNDPRLASKVTTCICKNRVHETQ